MPRGSVIYAGNNSRLREFAFRNMQGGLVGYRARTYPGAQGSIVNYPNRKRYQVRRTDGGNQDIAAPKNLSRSYPNDVWSLTGERIGSFVREDVVGAEGALVIRTDSSNEFRRIGDRFRALYQLSQELVRSFDNVHDDFDEGGSEADTRENFFDELRAISLTQQDFFAYSGHGSSQGLPSACIKVGQLPRLAGEIRRLLKPDGIVLLYACSTGEPGGFAEQISGHLTGMTVWGHIGEGPASRNSQKVKYQNGVKQDFLELLSTDERQAWRNHIRHNPDFYARFAFMTLEQIKGELNS